MLGDVYLEDIVVYLIVIDSIKFNVGMIEEVKVGGNKVVELLL